MAKIPSIGRLCFEELLKETASRKPNLSPRAFTVFSTSKILKRVFIDKNSIFRIVYTGLAYRDDHLYVFSGSKSFYRYYFKKL